MSISIEDLNTNHLTVSKINYLLSKTKDPNVYKYFVETGTYLGNSTLEASKVFEHVYTIEISEHLFYTSIQNCSSATNIKFYHGDSLVSLKEFIHEIDDGVVWFLDAHISGSDTTFNGKQFVPLLEELNIILSHVKLHNLTCIFIIDDVRLFSINDEWKDVSLISIKDLFKKYNVEMQDEYLMNDKYIIYT